MGFRINTNISSMIAQRALESVNEEHSSTLNKLSTGSRITKASDDSAGLAISEKLKAHIRSSRQAVRNTADGISLIQIAEGGLDEITKILIRLRELSMQSSSDTISDNERDFVDIEFQNLVREVERISSVTEFNGRRLLDGSGSTYEIQVGIKNNDFQDRIKFHSGKTNVKASRLGIAGLNVASKKDAQENLDTLDEALQTISGNRATLGAVQNRLNSAIQNLQISIEKSIDCQISHCRH